MRTAAGEAELPVRVTEHVVEGAVFVPFNQPGLAANTLLSGSFTIAATVEPVDAPERGSETVERCGGGCLMDWLDWLLLIARVVVVFVALLLTVMLTCGWSARSSPTCRRGSARTAPGPFGILITLADGIKLFFKEGITPDERRPARLCDRARAARSSRRSWRSR